VDAQDFRNITNYFRGIYGTYLLSVKKNWKITTCNRSDLENTRIWTHDAQKSPWKLVEVQLVPNPNWLHVVIFWLLVYEFEFEVYFLDSPKMMGEFPEVLMNYFNRGCFSNSTRFICNN
jgi:hypothetical protein